MLLLWLYACHGLGDQKRCGEVLDVGSVRNEATRPMPEDDVLIALGGDAMIGRGVAKQYADQSQPALWRNMGSVLGDVDVLAFNLESTIGTGGEKWPEKLFHFQADPVNARKAFADLPLKGDAHVYSSLANNHILDFGVEGLHETLDALDDFGVAYAGAGEDADQAQQPVIVQVGSIRIGFLSAADHCGCNDVCEWRADGEQAGMWYINGEARVWQDALAAVRALRSQVHWIVFSMHWGPNYRSSGPKPWMRELAADLVGAGVDIVHGHSSHHVLPIESRHDSTILYGSGAFIDDYIEEKGFRNDLSYLARIRLTRSGKQELEIVPMRVGHVGGHYLQPLDASDPDYDLVLEQAHRQAE